jgi:hypothetical protein
VTETDDNQNAYRLRELCNGLDKLTVLAHGLSADQLSGARTIDVVWANAPLILRLKFVRDILSDESVVQPALRQACAFEELRQRADELEIWLMRYPSLFADAVALLNSCTAECETTVYLDPAAMLAMETIIEVQKALARKLTECGIDWVPAEPGETITSNHEVVGDEPSPFSKTTIARTVRGGFSIRGKLELPAQVVRSSGPGVTLVPDHTTAEDIEDTKYALLNTEIQTPPHLTSPTQGRGTGWPNALTPREALTPNSSVLTPNTEHRVPIADPDWLRILEQRTSGCDAESVNEHMRHLRELVVQAGQADLPYNLDGKTDLSQPVLESLASLLSMRYADSIPGIGEEWGAILLDARDSILLWLHETLDIDPISPQRGDSFDSARMDAIETRRTVHADEIETVARLERVGLTRGGSPILRAEVVRYAAGRE